MSLLGGGSSPVWEWTGLRVGRWKLSGLARLGSFPGVFFFLNLWRGAAILHGLLVCFVNNWDLQAGTKVSSVQGSGAPCSGGWVGECAARHGATPRRY